MTTPIVGSTNARLGVGITRTRQTLRPRNRFTEVLRSGADLLLAGAGAASGLVGGPLLSAAVGAARQGLGRLGGGTGNSPLSATGSPTGTSSGAGGTEIDAMRKLQQEGQQASLQYLRLQQEMAQENRRFSLASSVLKAKHDTARAVLNNIRV